MNRRPHELRTRGTSCGQVTTPSSEASAAKRAISVTRSGEPGSAHARIRGLHLGQHRDRQDARAAQALGPAYARDLGARPRHHLGRAASRSVRMDVEHLDAEPRRLDGGAQHLLRAVVEFEIEENFGAAPANLADEIGAAADEQRAPDFEHPDHAREAVHQLAARRRDRAGRATRSAARAARSAASDPKMASTGSSNSLVADVPASLIMKICRSPSKSRNRRSIVQCGGCIGATALSRRGAPEVAGIRAECSLFARLARRHRPCNYRSGREMSSDCLSSRDSIGQLDGPAFPAPGEAGCSASF